jgi:hypothetical protein
VIQNTACREAVALGSQRTVLSHRYSRKMEHFFMSEQAMEVRALDGPAPRFAGLFAKTAVVHTVTYFFMGALAASVLHYKEAFARPEVACWMRQLNDPWLMAGPLFQPLRGLVFALAFYPL